MPKIIITITIAIFIAFIISLGIKIFNVFSFLKMIEDYEKEYSENNEKPSNIN